MAHRMQVSRIATVAFAALLVEQPLGLQQGQYGNLIEGGAQLHNATEGAAGAFWPMSYLKSFFGHSQEPVPGEGASTPNASANTTAGTFEPEAAAATAHLSSNRSNASAAISSNNTVKAAAATARLNTTRSNAAARIANHSAAPARPVAASTRHGAAPGTTDASVANQTASSTQAVADSANRRAGSANAVAHATGKQAGKWMKRQWSTGALATPVANESEGQLPKLSKKHVLKALHALDDKARDRTVAKVPHWSDVPDQPQVVAGRNHVHMSAPLANAPDALASKQEAQPPAAPGTPVSSMLRRVQDSLEDGIMEVDDLNAPFMVVNMSLWNCDGECAGGGCCRYIDCAKLCNESSSYRQVCHDFVWEENSWECSLYTMVLHRRSVKPTAPAASPKRATQAKFLVPAVGPNTTKQPQLANATPAQAKPPVPAASANLTKQPQLASAKAIQAEPAFAVVTPNMSKPLHSVNTTIAQAKPAIPAVSPNASKHLQTVNATATQAKPSMSAASPNASKQLQTVNATATQAKPAMSAASPKASKQLQTGNATATQANSQLSAASPNASKQLRTGNATATQAKPSMSAVSPSASKQFQTGNATVTQVKPAMSAAVPNASKQLQTGNATATQAKPAMSAVSPNASKQLQTGNATATQAKPSMSAASPNASKQLQTVNATATQEVMLDRVSELAAADSFLMAARKATAADAAAVIQEGAFVATAGNTDDDGENLTNATAVALLREKPPITQLSQDVDLTDVDMSILTPSSRRPIKPHIFIAVFSRFTAFAQRRYIREMWHQAQISSDGDATVRFAVCLDDSDIRRFDEVEVELNMFSDLLLLNCDEGYGEGKLTLKVISAMEAFLNNYQEKSLFMKVDDDSFVAWTRFSKLLTNLKTGTYMGTLIGKSVPCRNASYRWYEPFSTFPGSFFPASMAGGPGYVLSRDLVEKIIERRIAHNNVLWNEDRAVGVWVNELRAAGEEVEFVQVPGISGWWAWNWKNPTTSWKTWGDYPYYTHHELHGETINCLAKADKKNRTDSVISACFESEEGQTHEMLVCAAETLRELKANTTAEARADATKAELLDQVGLA